MTQTPNNISTDQNQGKITIFAEAHDNESAFAEARNRIKNADSQTTLMIEMRSVLNGPIEAFYEGKISKQELTTAFRGFLFQEYAKRAEFEADVIEEAKNKNIPVIAYDTREIGNAVGEHKTTIDSYINRKTEQLKTEIDNYEANIREHKKKLHSIIENPESKKNDIITEQNAITKIEAESIERRDTMLKSMEIIKANQDSKYNPVIEKITRDNMASGIDNQDIISAKAISTLQNKNNIIIAGEAHVSGADVREKLIYGRRLGASGILDEALEHLGHPVQVFSIRESIDSFVNSYKGGSPPTTREKYDGYLIVDEKTGKHLQSFKTMEELQNYANEHLSDTDKDDVNKGKSYIGLARNYQYLPTPEQHKEFGSLLQHIKEPIVIGTKAQDCGKEVDFQPPPICTAPKQTSKNLTPH